MAIDVHLPELSVRIPVQPIHKSEEHLILLLAGHATGSESRDRHNYRAACQFSHCPVAPVLTPEQRGMIRMGANLPFGSDRS